MSVGLLRSETTVQSVAGVADDDDEGGDDIFRNSLMDQTFPIHNPGITFANN